MALGWRDQWGDWFQNRALEWRVGGHKGDQKGIYREFILTSRSSTLTCAVSGKLSTFKIMLILYK